MKNKYLMILLMTFITLNLVGCSKSTHNTIINETVNVSYDITTLEDAVSCAIESVQDAVVTVKVYGKDSSIVLYSLYDTGSGAIYDGYATLKDGSNCSLSESITLDNIDYYTYYIFTNAHVININKNYTKITVLLAQENSECETTLVGYNSEFDCAVLMIQTSRYIEPLTWGDSTNLKAGQFVISIGSPRGATYANSATFGIVSYAQRILSDATYNEQYMFIQHDADINPGSSGGPLINLKGEIVGINAQRITAATSGTTTTAILAMNFAIPASLAKIVINSLTDVNMYQTILNITCSETIIDNTIRVVIDSSQDKQFKKGDIITSINGYEINNLTLYNTLSHYIFKTCTMTILRDNNPYTITI